MALVHEFAEYTRPAGRMSDLIESVDRVIVPASLIQDSVQAELLATRSSIANNIVVRPQGYLPKLPQNTAAAADLTRDEILAWIGADAVVAGPSPAGPSPEGTKVKIVLGAGYAQIRKGVDLFVQTASELRRLWGDKVRFIWVGDGYHPKTDLQYSVWVEDMVRRLDLERHVFFLPAQSSLDTLFALSDVFYLPSGARPGQGRVGRRLRGRVEARPRGRRLPEAEAGAPGRARLTARRRPTAPAGRRPAGFPAAGEPPANHR